MDGGVSLVIAKGTIKKLERYSFVEEHQH